MYEEFTGYPIRKARTRPSKVLAIILAAVCIASLGLNVYLGIRNYKLNENDYIIAGEEELGEATFAMKGSSGEVLYVKINAKSSYAMYNYGEYVIGIPVKDIEYIATNVVKVRISNEVAECTVINCDMEYFLKYLYAAQEWALENS